MQICKFGVQPAKIPAYVELWSVVAPADRKDELPA